jgi:DNA polymerase V
MIHPFKQRVIIKEWRQKNPQPHQPALSYERDMICSCDPGLVIEYSWPVPMKVEGDSMEGAGIFCGGLLIVDKGMNPKAGQVIIGVVNQQPLVKYLAFVGRHTVLRPANRKYPDRFIMEGDEFDIWGVVTQSVRDHARN